MKGAEKARRRKMGREQKGQKAREAEETKGAAEKEGKRGGRNGRNDKGKRKKDCLVVTHYSFNKYLLSVCHWPGSILGFRAQYMLQGVKL